jgi:hypothetical protein
MLPQVAVPSGKQVTDEPRAARMVNVVQQEHPVVPVPSLVWVGARALAEAIWLGHPKVAFPDVGEERHRLALLTGRRATNLISAGSELLMISAGRGSGIPAAIAASTSRPTRRSMTRTTRGLRVNCSIEVRSFSFAASGGQPSQRRLRRDEPQGEPGEPYFAACLPAAGQLEGELRECLHCGGLRRGWLALAEVDTGVDYLGTAGSGDRLQGCALA